MNVRILFLLLVCKATKCGKIAASRTLFEPKIDDKCKNIKCSAQEDPTCAKIKHLKDTKKVFYVLALNKCEMQFMKCHKDYEANIVAMKLCDHENVTKSKKIQNNTLTRRGRVKRSIFALETTTKVHDEMDSSSSEEHSGYKIHTDDVYDDKHSTSISSKKKAGLKLNRDRNLLATMKTVPPKRKDRDRGRKYTKTGLILLTHHDRNFMTTMKKVFKVSGDDQVEKDNIADLNNHVDYGKKSIKWEFKLGGDGDDGEEQYKLSDLKLTVDDTAEKEGVSDEDGGHKLDVSGQVTDIHSAESLKEEFPPDVLPLFSEETIAERKNNADDAVPENNDVCPRSCPSHVDMICVKCKHGIYKTFLSTCHLRQYCCSHGGESRRLTESASRASEASLLEDLCKDIELISRHSCILSAPFIDGAAARTHGRVYDQHGGDVILSYIKCKSLQLLGKSDPRCPF